MSNSAQQNTKICPNCQKEFSFRRNKIYCSSICRFKHWAKEHPRVKLLNIDNKI